MTRQVQLFSAGLFLQLASGLAITCVLSAMAFALCQDNYDDCDEVVVYLCRDPIRGARVFVGGSNLGNAGEIASDQARRAGYDTDNCILQPRKTAARPSHLEDAPFHPVDVPSHKRILDTGYDRLLELGAEGPGYGLYSYVLIPAASKTSVALIREIISVFPTVESAAAARSQINILYLPFRKQRLAEYLKKSEVREIQAEVYLNSFYDFQLARAILNHLCNPPAPAVRYICEGDRSRGPFIFTYATPASKSEPVDPPYLLVDLRDVHEQAVSEFVAAYQAQITSSDFSDRKRLDTLRLAILNVTLNASDVTTAIVHAVGLTIPK
jgi:hypothetical protein